MRLEFMHWAEPEITEQRYDPIIGEFQQKYPAVTVEQIPRPDGELNRRRPPFA